MILGVGFGYLLIQIVYYYYTPSTFIISLPFITFYFTAFLFTIANCYICEYFSSIFFYHGYLFIQKTNHCLIEKPSTSILFQKFINLKLNYQLRMFINQHNHYCTFVGQFNPLWSRLYLSLLMVIPMSLLMTHQILFEDVDREWRTMLSFMCVILHSVFFFNSFICGYLSELIHRMSVPLSRRQWTLKSLTNGLRLKIKTMSYFERLAANRRIGLTIGPTIALTLPIFAKVIVKVYICVVMK